MKKICQYISLLLFAITVSGCQSAYYSTMEKFGQHKRDILVDRVENAQESQEEAQEQFKSAVEQLSALIEFDGGELQSQYEATLAQYEASEEAAADVSSRIESIESVANALFDEWAEEIDQYSNAKLQRQSKSQLGETQRKYQRLIKAMHKAESKMEPVLSALKDNTLYLKHNLNAKAIGALESEFLDIKSDVNTLIKEMNNAIVESQSFISSLKSE